MRSKILHSLTIRLATREEVPLWDSLMKEYHYLGLNRMPGESLRYLASAEGTWLALIGWSSAALKCSVRDRYIGWATERKLTRLIYLTNNVRFLILPWISEKNLASRILSLNTRRLSQDYQDIYGHPVFLAETFVDFSRFNGTCYRASNWKCLGVTKGYSKNGRYYYENGNPKGVFIYPLTQRPLALLNADFLPVGGVCMPEKSRLALQNIPVEGLKEKISQIIDPRKRRGIRHPLVNILSLSVAAVLCGARSYIAIAEWASSLPKETLARFGCKRKAPSEPTIRRVLQKIDVESFDDAIGSCLMGLLPSRTGIAIDGKTLRGSGDEKVHLLSAIIHKEGIVIGQTNVDGKTNEITRVDALFSGMDIEGAVVTGDALLTQKEIARHIVEDKKAHYCLTVKDNQETLRNDIEALRLEAFPP
jgi:Druantia protein DruA/DDE_Tnp_1-associated/Transposase DDE domain